MTKDHYLLRFQANDQRYDAAQARKKNADIRKIVMIDGPEERREAIKAAWAEHYGEKK